MAAEIPHRLRPDLPIPERDPLVRRQLLQPHRPANKETSSSLVLLRDNALDEAFDFSSQHREVGAREAHLRRGNTMMFDIGRDVFVVGMVRRDEAVKHTKTTSPRPTTPRSRTSR